MVTVLTKAYSVIFVSEILSISEHLLWSFRLNSICFQLLKYLIYFHQNINSHLNFVPNTYFDPVS